MLLPTMHSAVDSYLFPRRTQVIMVLDVVESVRLMEQDEHGFIRTWHGFVQHAREQVLPAHGGRMLKSLGDGLMCEFDEPQGSVQAAYALHGWFEQANAGCAPQARMLLRIGAHMAEFVADEHDIYGTGVNLTARVASLAGPGETVVTASVRDRLADGLDGEIEDLGECHLKHLKEPVRAFRVGAVGEAPVIRRGPSDILLKPTFAVIPFRTLSAEPAHAMLGDAVADDVIAALARSPELHVISRLSSTAFRDRPASVDDIHRHLGADFILSGSCRVAGEQLLLVAELVERKTGLVTWADTFRGDVRGVFSAEGTLVAELVAAVGAAVTSRAVERARHHALPTIESYGLLLGSIALMHRNSLSDLERAQAMLDHLIARNPRHPAAHAWLAKLHVLKVQQGWFADRTTDARLALDCSRRALDCDPESSLALTIDGFVRTNLFKDLDAAADRYREALRINPNESLAWLLTGTLHAFKDEGVAALSAAERALKLSPLDPLRYFYDSLAATAAVTAGDYERAVTLARRSLRANRAHTSTYRSLAIALSLSGRLDEARAAIDELLQREPGFSVRSFLDRTPAGGPLARKVAAALSAAGLPQA